MTITSASLVASRSSGVAPLAVWFDCAATTSDETSIPFHEVDYLHDFDDVSAGTWAEGAGVFTDKNAATGPIACHVFESGGTFNVITYMCDGVDVDSATVEITVSDPNTYYPGTNTVCVSTSGNFTGAPSGANEVTSSDFDSMIATHLNAANKRVLFRNGEAFTASSAGQISQSGCTVGSFGTGATPTVQANAGCLQINASGDDFRAMDLDIDGGSGSNSDSAVYFTYQVNIDRVTLLRLTIDNVNNNSGINCYQNEYTGSKAGGGYYHEIAVVDCIFPAGQDGYLLYCDAWNAAYMGNFLGQPTGNHSQRTSWSVKSVFAHNTYAGAAAGQHNLKLDAPVYTTTPYWNEQFVVSDNHCSGYSPSNWPMAVGPQNGDAGSDERVRDAIFDRNWFTVQAGAASVGTMLHLWVDGFVTVRNCLFDMSSGTGGSIIGINVEKRGSSPPSPNNVYIHNNSFFTADVGNLYGIILSSATSDCVVQNNIGHAPNNSSGSVMVSNSGTNNTVNNNSTNAFVDGATNPYVSPSPRAAPSNFQLNGNGTIIGVATPSLQDAFGVWRFGADDAYYGFDQYIAGTNPHAGAGGFEPSFSYAGVNTLISLLVGITVLGTGWMIYKRATRECEPSYTHA